MEVMFVEARYTGNISGAFLKKISDALKPYKKINVVAAIQYIDQMNYVVQNIKDKEFILLQSKYRAMYPGQILGCDVEAARCEDCDTTLAFTQGVFHLLGMPVKFGKDLINVDPESESITFVDGKTGDKYRKKVLQSIGTALSAKNVMFIESLKSGQTYGVTLLKKALKQRGVRIFSIISDEVNFNRLNELRGVDVFINTACQRIAIDDMEKLERPIVNAEDLEPYLLR